MTLFLGAFVGGDGYSESDFCWKIPYHIHVCVRTDRWVKGQPNVDRCGQEGQNRWKCAGILYICLPLLNLLNLARFTLPDWKIMSVKFVRMWSMREEVLHGTCVEQVIKKSRFLWAKVWTINSIKSAWVGVL